ncbi:MAG TPA: hypothetical protein VIJ43_06500 [Burkholderiales bacterium]
MALTLPKLTIPKPALPKLTLTKKQIPAVVGGVVVLLALGWFGWQYFFEEAAPPPAAPSKPQAVTAAKPPAAAKATAADAARARDKLVEDLLVASGLNQQLSQLPRELTAVVRQQTKASPAVLKATENAAAESFTAQGFHDRVSADLKKNFDEKRLQALLKDYSTPAAKRMVELEQAAPSHEELAQFARSAAATPPSPQRTSLIERIDSATKASDLAIDAAFASLKGIALGSAGAGADKAAAVDKAIEKQRAAASKDIRNATLLNLAFGYRNASDAELEAYAKFYETENSKWFTGIVTASMLEEVKSASAQAGERIGALADKGAAPAAKPVRSKSRSDARICLALATNQAIIKCAEQYR